METIGSLLARALGHQGRQERRESTDFESLPKALQDLVKSINRSTDATEKSSSASERAASNRQERINALQGRFNEGLRELADAMAAMNAFQADELKQAENRSKLDEARRKREEAALSRAEKLSAFKTRENAAKEKLGAGLFGAIFGKGIGEIASNVLNAQEKTRKDVAELAEARYSDIVATANDEKAEAFEAAESKRAGAVARAVAGYTSTAAGQAESLGSAIVDAKANDALLAASEASSAAYEAAKKLKDKIAAETAERLSSENATGAVMSADTASGPAPAPSAVPLIITPEGKDAIAEAAAGRERERIAARNIAAEEEAAAAGDAFVKASAKDAVVAPRYVGAVMQGEMAAETMRTAGESARSAVKEALIAEASEKAKAEGKANLAMGMAFADKASGSLVSQAEQKSMGMSNLLTTAVAPPAVTIIAKVMEKFMGMFPVIEKSGNALIELGTVLPAALFTTAGQLQAKLLYGLSAVRDALPYAKPSVRKKYDEADERLQAAGYATGADLYKAAQERNLALYEAESKAKKENPDTLVSVAGLSRAGRTPRANMSPDYTVENIPGTSMGVAHMAPDVATAKKSREAPAVSAPAPKDSPLGVIPVGPGSSSVDHWRN